MKRRNLLCSISFILLQLFCEGLSGDSFEILTQAFARKFGVDEVTVAELKARQAAGKPTLLLDVRTSSEQSVSILAGAVTTSPEQDLASLPEVQTFIRENKGKDAQIVAYCAVGYRSSRSIARMSQKLPLAIKNLQGGIFAYLNSGGQAWNGKTGQFTRKVHGYDQFWARFVEKPAEAVLTAQSK